MEWLVEALNENMGKPEGPIMPEQMKELALYWYAVEGCDLQTMARQFKIVLEEMQAELDSEE